MKITLEMNGSGFKKFKDKTATISKAVIKAVKTKRIAVVDKECN